MTTTRPTRPELAIHNVRRAWRRTTFLHWPVPITQVASRLPVGLVVDTFEGHAWVGLIPFETSRSRPGVIPSWSAAMPQTIVRTYVVGGDGPGLWYDSLDTSRLLPIPFARATFGLPYNWADMSITTRGQVVEYRTRRRWPERVATSNVAVVAGRSIDRPDPLEIFLTARRRLYSRIGRRLAVTRVAHDPWPLHAARVTALDDGLVATAGYVPLGDTPHVMYSPGVTVALDRPRPIR